MFFFSNLKLENECHDFSRKFNVPLLESPHEQLCFVSCYYALIDITIDLNNLVINEYAQSAFTSQS